MADPNLARMARIVLALGVGAVGATIPGFLHVEYSLGGFVARGTGGLAMFLIGFFGSPEVEALNLRAGHLSLEPVRSVEFRAMNAPDRLLDLDPNSETATTLYLRASNSSDQLGRPVEIINTAVYVAVEPGGELPFEWQYFVEHITGDRRLGSSPEARHLGAQSDVSTISIAPATSAQRGILHVPARTNSAARAFTWQMLLNAALQGQIKRVRVRVETREQGSYVTTCAINREHARRAIERSMERLVAIPRYLVARCEGRSEWTRETTSSPA
jgi:hypothetical protein